MKKLQDMAYPIDFNFNNLLALPSYTKRVNYVEEKLQRISSGSSRIVYKIDEEKVLKVAKNKKGLSQNIVESDWGIQSMYSNEEKIVVIDFGLTNWVWDTEYAKNI